MARHARKYLRAPCSGFKVGAVVVCADEIRSFDHIFLSTHMNEFTTAILLVALLGASSQDSTMEEKAVFRVQQTTASRYDPTLPNRSFGNWLNQVVGPQSGLSWRLGECVEQDGRASEWEQGIPACVEATAILPDDRKVVAQIHVGSFKGLAMATRFHFAAVESGGQFQSVRRLSDLPQLLLEPSSVKRKRLNIVALPQIKLTGAPWFYSVEAPEQFGLPKIETVAEMSPPSKPAPPRVSKSVTAGNALTKVTPIFPPIAKMMNASGAVQVAITIDENGLVIEAKAISGHPALRSAAEDAARKWVFRPASLDGKPIRQQDVLTFNFNPLQ
jgi:TonB family protein